VKFGVLQFFSWPERRVPLEVVYARALQRIQIMDDTGYDAVWLAEHHFSTYSVCPSVHILGTHVAARTKNLRIGTAVSLAALYHPLRLAEEVALLDVLSGGRVNWGAGRGFDPTEFRAFGVDSKQSRERYFENVQIVLGAWTSDRLTFHGRFHDFEDIEVLPKPLQKPHPPTWLASTSPDAIELSASHGYDILMDPHSSHAEIGRKRQLYADALSRHGYSIAAREIPVARLLAVAEDAGAAEQIARDGAKWTVGAYAHGLPGAAQDPVQRYVDEVVIHGTPEAVVDQIQRLREEIGLEYLMCAPFSHSSFMLFTEKVLPKLR
jgi:alkanesulfonate monooxygenase SsuD/methylene tetrahydromethanopterin reductase-like flavin-dependent oxidoreductase (luciferase family)